MEPNPNLNPVRPEPIDSLPSPSISPLSAASRSDPTPAAMEDLNSLVNKLQLACTLADNGVESAIPTEWNELPFIAIVGAQVHAPRTTRFSCADAVWQ